MDFITILAFIAFTIIAVRWLTSFLNLLTGMPVFKSFTKQNSDVSILIPARNEAKNLPGLFQSLLKCDETVGEIIIYDDQSEDETAAIVKLWKSKDCRIRLIKGKEVPPDWKGKNHACYRLAEKARGNYLLFLDADVTVNQDALDLALSNIKHNHLALFSFFPHQEMKTLGEWLLVAQVNIILISLLPLAISRFIPWSLMTAANGQFMLFDGKIYREHQFHQAVKNQAVEDIAIAQYIKKKNLKVRTALAPEGLKCRMYTNYRDALQGLARSARFFFGGNIFAGWIYVIFSSLGWLPIVLSISPTWLLAYFLLLFSMRIFVSIASGTSVIRNLLLMPLQQIALIHLFYIATRQLILKETTWKGRKI
ncbi:glycosyltransferase family 2 protein [Marinilabilia sp.]|uniref:glycosyltransferase n=1 Tax=Marinilabilia sp. TaxID=2021252 RepID=UPI0025BE5181|nr:glycosyltransferase family 2 protein [Marinilabilia sp.]